VLAGGVCSQSSHFFNLKNAISTLTKDFCEENGPNSIHFEKEIKLKAPDFYNRFQQVAKI
jgi:hypothetical protein